MKYLTNLLAGGMSRIEAVTIAILCVAIVLFVLTDIILLVSIHRKNKKITRSSELNAPDDDAGED